MDERDGDRMRGFSLVELIAALSIAGLLAAVATPLFFNRLTYDTRAFSEKAESMLRYAQKSAIAKRRTVCVNLSSQSIRLSFASSPGGTCDQPLPGPTGDAAFDMNAPSGVSLSTNPALSSFSFDAAGRPSLASRLDIEIIGDSSHVFHVETETGYVHE
ncbi:MAG: prepilin-type N-terminal cleavage/methylation domain-containing protein [Burkholderiales bacterium]|nr:prepilin-type N-terminal cleavage/methylation domain-containing protein [Burkholderiales bacterium]